jgi:O-acetyl-ADP-ribose deacetylase (regulator of RNase III)
MGIIYVAGDLLTSDVDVLAHGANCFNTMGAGIAAQIKRLYPEAWEVDSLTKKGDKKKLGSFSRTQYQKPVIYNLYTQYSFGKNKIYVDYKAVRKALKAMKNDLIKTGYYKTCKLGMPMIGCGLAGGDWQKISQILEEILNDKDVFVYTLSQKEAI